MTINNETLADAVDTVTITDANFESAVLKSLTPVMVDFWADWCGPCHAIAPTIQELAREYKGRILVGKLDVDQNPQTAVRYAIRSIPTTLFLKDGAVVDRVVGAVPKDTFVEKLDGLL